ncbi:MAG TPA: SDR family oxidoreductase [Rugosimonospora sp.]|nr:SDR family oxidoreductase [Rugosimonospora sp.]
MGRAVLVTGASRGIGRAAAQAFAASGDRVAVHYRSRSELAEGVRAGLPGDGHLLVRADLGDLEAVRAMVDSVADGFGGIDVLVNNANMGNVELKSPRGPEIRAQSPFNRVALPEEVAAAIVWLASPEAQWASGTVLDFNGASYLRT